MAQEPEHAQHAQGQDTEALFRQYVETKSTEIRNELVERHLDLAEILAHKYLNHGVELDDLIQVASYGLLLAVERFDPDRGIKFVTFATPTIIGEIKKYFRDTTWSVKVPRRLKEIAIRIPLAKKELEETLQYIPTVQELSDFMNVSEEEVLEALESSRAYTAYSIDHPNMQEPEEDAESGYNNYFERHLGDEEKGYESFELSSVLDIVLGGLSERERDILKKRFLQEMTQRDVAKALGVSQMTVSRIERAVQEKFRAEYNR
ncbi:MAG: SigB/SigF/SigG family RNA polymerase sigma factor [Clostridiales bacterium]|nr:SigB/SigF/SigG family RNA polymerase sigma factor [Clostridiales bacterium]